ncbi:MAG: hypothetical protein K2J10_04985 [Muribaculaceae bacterium]|nr:hypothetical protein [Muribaculaceae bacterium]
MSEEEKVILFQKIGEGIIEAQRRLFERKAKLGEDVIIADAEGNPIKISAAEALTQLKARGQA